MDRAARKGERYLVNVRGAIRFEDSQAEYAVWVRDISTGGAWIECIGVQFVAPNRDVFGVDSLRVATQQVQCVHH